jgi:uncharacterized membrane protein YqhA
MLTLLLIFGLVAVTVAGYFLFIAKIRDIQEQLDNPNRLSREQGTQLLKEMRRRKD